MNWVLVRRKGGGIMWSCSHEFSPRRHDFFHTLVQVSMRMRLELKTAPRANSCGIRSYGNSATFQPARLIYGMRTVRKIPAIVSLAPYRGTENHLSF